MRLAPWNRGWLNVNPDDFERIVVDYLRSLERGLTAFSVQHRASLAGPDGEFEIDALARFEALGADFLVLVECKHHRNPIKRELVQVLRDKVRSLGAHKGMLFSTGGFQRGAVEYAESQKIALVHFTPGGPQYEVRSYGAEGLPSRAHDAFLVTLHESGLPAYRSGRGSLLSLLFGDVTD